MIQVTRPFLPPREEYQAMVDQIWERNWLTNNGPLLVALEQQLTDYLGVHHLSVMTNGTVTMQAILKTLPPKGKILTTPFSYIATSSALIWENFTPVFVDIDASTFNADAQIAESYVDDQTVGVLITHCFGVPCDTKKWGAFSEKYNLPIIYDAAHAFGVKVDGQSVLNYGYASSLSFHATKLFHTIEGGAVVTSSATLKREMELKRNFGHDGPELFSSVGINGKNSEFHAAMGLVNLKYVDKIIETRKAQYVYYREHLNNTKIDLGFQSIPENVTYNYSYFPVLFSSEEELLRVVENLNKKEVYPRRYFYPALNNLSFTKAYQGTTPVADRISKRILCLPMFFELTSGQQDMIIDIILNR